MATSIRDNLSTGMNYLRRRFSSDDLYSEHHGDDQDVQRLNLAGVGAAAAKKIGMTTAPSFPSFSGAQGIAKNILAHTMPGGLGGKVLINKDKCKVVLVIDDRHTDWMKYFRGRKVFGDWDLRVEQAEFSEISVASFSDAGAVVDISVTKNGNKVVQSFKPDFVLVRQHAHDATDNWKHIVLALHYGGLPSVNSLQSVYNFLDKPWVFSHLIQIQKRLGSDRFPLIDQSFYPNYKEMISNLWMVMPKFPVVVKIGHAHAGVGKVKVDSHHGFQDIASVMAVTNCYSTTEPHIDAQCDIYIQKIGNNYRAFMRKAMSGNWKANVGSATLEPCAMNDRFRLWVDECAQLFGGLDMLAVKAIRAVDGREYIIEVTGSSMMLFGSSQDEDFAMIADLVINKLEVYCKPQPPGSTSTMSKTTSAGAALTQYAQNGGTGSGLDSRPSSNAAGPAGSARKESAGGNNPGGATNTGGGGGGQPGGRPPYGGSASANTTPQRQAQPPGNLTQTIANDSSTTANSVASRPPPVVTTIPHPTGPASPGTIAAIARELEAGEEQDDTMNNLRKTFAGIFGSI